MGSGDGLGVAVEADVGPLPDARVSDSLRSAGRVLQVGSMVAMVQSPAAPIGMVVACVESMEHTLYVVVDKMDAVRARQGKAAFCRRNESSEIWYASEVEQCLAWRQDGTGEYVVILA